MNGTTTTDKTHEALKLDQSELECMAKRYDFMYLLACNQKGYISDADYDEIIKIQERSAK